MANLDANGWNQAYNPMAHMIWDYAGTPGPTRYMTEDEVKGAKAKQYFQLFFTPDVMQHILDETNGYANRQRAQNPQKHRSKWYDVSMPELEIFLGMTLLMGIIRLPIYHMYFQTEHKLLATNIADPMARDRFLQIKRYLHVADETVADPDDKLRKVRPLLDLVTPHFAEEYVMDQETAIDEAMIPYKRRLNIKQYMSAKPTKWGIKVWCLNEARTGYGWRLQVYTGAGADGVPETNQTTRVVLDLMFGLGDQGYHLYTDNLYTSPILASILQQNHIYTCGTIRVYPHPRRYFPREIVVTKNEAKQLDRGNYVWRTNGPQVAMRWMDKKPVYLLSTIQI
ncbi:piggyBac transposable element-derived protein 4-like [Lineus longissimus]|uniref:piggyBac transposable element-derived protein 4-like n=1 Tax=Lineus longissimus TaxID=88925 RepID=UPI00315CDE79